MDAMDLRQLEAFAAVMSAGSLTAAGQLLGRSQSAISRLIQDLETEIGYVLFTRSRPCVTPSEKGLLFYEEVRRTLGGLQQIRIRSEEIARGEHRPLRVAATAALAAGLLPHALKQLREQAGPDLPRRFGVQSLLPEQVVKSVAGESVDLGIASLPIQSQGTHIHWVAEVSCVLALPKGHRLARHETVALSALGDSPIITMANPYRLKHRLDQAMAQNEIHPSFSIETNSTLNALAMVRNGMGISIVEPVSALGGSMDDIVIRPIDVHIPYLFGVITAKGALGGEHVARLIGCLKDQARLRLPKLVEHDPQNLAAIMGSLYSVAEA
nr:LysR family transcriptional regulator [Candidimonas nitroreducens]